MEIWIALAYLTIGFITLFGTAVCGWHDNGPDDASPYLTIILWPLIVLFVCIFKPVDLTLSGADRFRAYLNRKKTKPTS